MFQMPRGKFGSVENGFTRPGVIEAGSRAPADWAPEGLDLGFLWRGRWLIVAGVVLGILGAIAADLVLVPRYRATAQILIAPTDLRGVEKDVLVSPAQTADASVLQVESESRVLTSDKVLMRVVQKEDLANDPEFRGRKSMLGDFVATVLAPFRRAGRPETNPDLTALREFKRDVTAVRSDKSYVVDLTVESEDPDKSAQLANAVTMAYFDEQAAARTAAARRVSDSLVARLAELKSRVQKADEAVARYKSENNLVGAGGLLVPEQQIVELNKLLTAARAHTAETKARYDQVLELQRKGLDAGSTSEAVNSNTIGRLREQYGAAARLEASLSAKLGPLHPDVRDARAQAQKAQRLVNDEIKRVSDADRGDYQSALANEKSLTTRLDGLKRESVETDRASVRLRELDRDVEASRAVYESFLVRSRETQEQERLDTANIRVISDAQAPIERYFPPRRLVMFAGGAAAGLMLGVGFAGLGELVRRARA
jgi:polysaccharide biosynthesis transport protein